MAGSDDMRAAHSPVKLIYDDFVHFPDDGKRHELDETIKRRLYERSGVLEYWVVDPVTDVVRIYRRDGDRFARVTELSREADDVLTTPLFPALDLPLARIFRE
jgi:Uma2 family endonuclease